MDINKFVKENEKIVSLFGGGEDYNPVVIEITYDGKISEENNNPENVLKLYELIQNPEYKTILWVAPTGSGKTYTTSKLMEMIEAYLVVIFCPNRCQNEQNGNEYKIMDCVVGGKKLDNTDLNEKLRLSAVYDKANTVLEEIWRRANVGQRNPIVFVDEAHILTEAYSHDFRENAINMVKDLADDVVNAHNGKIVFITATPSQLKNMRFDLIINCVPTNYIPVAKKITILETGTSDVYAKVVFEQIVKMVRDGKIPFVRLNNKPLIDKIQEKLAELDIVSESVSSDEKTYDYNKATKEITYHNNIYHGIVANNGQLPRKTRDNQVIKAYFCTSVLECGTNVVGISGEKDLTLTPVFCVPDAKNASPDSIEQFFNRLRYQINDCYVIIKSQNYNTLVSKAIKELGNLENVIIKANDSGTCHEVCTTDSKIFRQICITCNKSRIFYNIKKMDDVNKKYIIDICKKSYIELDKVLSDQIVKNKNNFELLNNIYTNLKSLHNINMAKKEMDEILKKPTANGMTNSQGIVKRTGDKLYIDNCSVWKSAHDLHCKQYFYLKDLFYSVLKERLGITNISIKKAEPLNLNIKAIEASIKEKTLKTIENEIKKNDDLMDDILENRKVDGLKSIRKTDEYKSFIKFAKLNHNLNAAYAIVKDSNKSRCDKLYNLALKKRVESLTYAEKSALEKLAKMEELDYSIVKGEESLEIIKIIVESGFWALIKKAVDADIAIKNVLNQIAKEENSNENVRTYIKNAIMVRHLKDVDYDYKKLGDTIVEREIKIAMKMFYKAVVDGKLKQDTIKDSDLIRLQNALNYEMKDVSSARYAKKDAKALLKGVFKTREKGKDFAIISLAKAATV